MRFLLFVFAFCSLNVYGQQKIHFVEIGLKQALDRAKIENKMVFIDAYAKWCRPCKQMDIEFKNPAVIKYFNKNFINVKVNVEEPYGLDYKQDYQIIFLPSLIFTDFNGKQRTKIDNVVSGNELLSVAKFINNKYGPSGKKNLAVSADKPTKVQDVQPTPLGSSPLPVYKGKPPPPKEERAIVETTSKPVEKVLYVMGTDNTNLPPDVLKQEAYFRMQLMDGSHHESAKNYLATQANWLTEDNMRFVFDFIKDCKSELFKHVVNNRQAYESLVGKNNVLNTLGILIHKELDQAYPRPTKQDAYILYSILNKETAEELSSIYFLEGLFNTGNFIAFSSHGIVHIKSYPLTNTELTYRVCDKTIQHTKDKKTLKAVKEKLLHLKSSDKNNELYYFSLARTYLKLKNRKKAIENINTAASICKSKGIKNSNIITLFELLEDS